MVVPTKTMITELKSMGLEDGDTLIKYLLARRMTSLEVFRLAGNCYPGFYTLLPGGVSSTFCVVFPLSLLVGPFKNTRCGW